MAKNKSKAQKRKDVFQVASKKHIKAKSKAKPVTTNLKKINALNSEKVSDMNKSFMELQREVKSLSKGCSSEPKNHQQALTCRGNMNKYNVPLGFSPARRLKKLRVDGVSSELELQVSSLNERFAQLKQKN